MATRVRSFAGRCERGDFAQRESWRSRRAYPRVRQGEREGKRRRHHRRQRRPRQRAAPWGRTAQWCDSSGIIEGQRAGVTIMPDPMNFRPSWFHARDCGLLVANPFSRKAFTGEEESRIVVAPGTTLRIRFGILVHGSDGAQASDSDAAYRDFLEVLTTEPLLKPSVDLPKASR